MPPRTRSNAVTIAYLALGFVIAFHAPADGRMSRSRDCSAIAVALQPFLLQELDQSRESMEMTYYIARSRRTQPPRPEYSGGMDHDGASGPRRADDEGLVKEGGARPIVAGRRAALRNGVVYAPADGTHGFVAWHPVDL